MAKLYLRHIRAPNAERARAIGQIKPPHPNEPVIKILRPHGIRNAIKLRQPHLQSPRVILAKRIAIGDFQPRAVGFCVKPRQTGQHPPGKI